MNKKQYQKYLKSAKWKAVTEVVKNKALWRCQLCNSGLNLQTHHRSYEHLGDELSHLEDLICICNRCHTLFHGISPNPFAATTQNKPVKVPKTSVKASKLNKRVESQKKKKKRPDEHFEKDVASLPEGDAIVLTADLLVLFRTESYGITSATMKALGIPSRPPKGWVKNLVGKTYSREHVIEAIEGRSQFV